MLEGRKSQVSVAEPPNPRTKITVTMFVPILGLCKTRNPISWLGDKADAAPAAVGSLPVVEWLDCEVSVCFRLKCFCRINMFSRACVPLLCVFTPLSMEGYL